MEFLFLWTSFLAGMLTVVSPCVLPVLPVIISGSAGTLNPWRPLIIITSLAMSIVIFTLLLKVSTIFVDVPPQTWTAISGGIIFLFGFITLFPVLWDTLSLKLGFVNGAYSLLTHAELNPSIWGPILLGSALGPVFSSCSPTYFVILSTVLPVDFFMGLVYLMVYATGLALLLGLIGIFGQRFTDHLRWTANPNGWFKRGLGLVLVLVGLSILTGFEKKIELSLIDAGFGTTALEKRLLDETIGGPGPS